MRVDYVIDSGTQMPVTSELFITFVYTCIQQSTNYAPHTLAMSSVKPVHCVSAREDGNEGEWGITHQHHSY